ncbi:MAG: winged helix-turn-helix transcriptional regulator [Phormidesmis sp. RL_2_1]|nr:winged helix-turn-helix transcriptional regulator [Phormidesmis sp. RL_2_1]
MVERSANLDIIFKSLADATRRDILQRVSQKSLSISALAEPYELSFAAIAKHISVLETAQLITKRREGKQHMISLVPKTLATALTHLEQYEKLWQDRFDALETLLQEDEP